MNQPHSTQTGKIEFRVIKDSNGEEIHLDNLSLETSKTFLALLQNLVSIAELESSEGDDVTINVKEGSLKIGIEASESKIDQIQDNILQVVNNNKDRKKPYVKTLKTIKSVLASEGYEFEAFVYNRNKSIPIRDYFGAKFIGVKKKKEKAKKLNIEFLSGKLSDIGGGRANFHIETISGRKTIRCSEIQATAINKIFPVYTKIQISAWNLSLTGVGEYILCDYFTDEKLFNDFKKFVEKNESIGGTEPLKQIHRQLEIYYSNQDFKLAKKLIRMYNHDLTDVNRLRSILLISKSFKDNDELKDLLEAIEMRIEKKIGRKLF